MNQTYGHKCIQVYDSQLSIVFWPVATLVIKVPVDRQQNSIHIKGLIDASFFVQNLCVQIKKERRKNCHFWLLWNAQLRKTMNRLETTRNFKTDQRQTQVTKYTPKVITNYLFFLLSVSNWIAN